MKNETNTMSDEIFQNTIDENNSNLHRAKIVGFMSGKGGVGKTGLAINVCNFCAENGAKVLLIDCDMGTNGATMFFCIDTNFKKKLRDSNDVLDFQDILENLLNKSALGVTTEFNEVLPITIKNNFDFIPAGIDKNVLDERELTDDLLAQLEEKLEDYFSVWRTTYDLVVMDFGAGESRINSLLSRISDDICIVMHSDEISRQSVRMKLGYLFNEISLDNITCCVNMTQSGERANNVGLICEFNGFAHSLRYAEIFQEGRMIDIDNSLLCERLSSIVNSIWAENSVVSVYREKIEEQILDRRYEYEKRLKRNKRRTIRLIIAIIITIIIIFTICMCEIFKVDIPLWQYAIFVIILGLIDWLIIGRGKIYNIFVDWFYDLVSIFGIWKD